MSGPILLYGATGYSGRLIAERMAALGLPMILSGRDRARLERLSAALGGRPWLQASLEDEAELRAALVSSGAVIVVHAAGPFTHTASTMMRACLAAGVHYLDISGEWRATLAAMELSDVARSAGVMLLPAAGFTATAGVCLMRLAHERAPEMVSLRLAFSTATILSRGTIGTAALDAGAPQVFMRDGRLAQGVLGRVTRAFAFGEGLRNTLQIGVPEVIVGTQATGVRTIEVFSEIDPARRLGFVAMAAGASLVGAGQAARWGRALAQARPDPTPARRRRTRYELVVEGQDRWRRPRTFRMRTLDGYSATAAIVSDLARRVVEGMRPTGFCTALDLAGPRLLFDLGCAAPDPTTPL